MIQGDDQSGISAKGERGSYPDSRAGGLGVHSKVLFYPGDDIIFNTVLPLFWKVKSKLKPYALTIDCIIAFCIEQFLVVITISQP